jgi:hypothetical protein
LFENRHHHPQLQPAGAFALAQVRLGAMATAAAAESEMRSYSSADRTAPHSIGSGTGSKGRKR